MMDFSPNATQWIIDRSQTLYNTRSIIKKILLPIFVEGNLGRFHSIGIDRRPNRRWAVRSPKWVFFRILTAHRRFSPPSSDNPKHITVQNYNISTKFAEVPSKKDIIKQQPHHYNSKCNNYYKNSDQLPFKYFL